MSIEQVSEGFSEFTLDEPTDDTVCVSEQLYNAVERSDVAKVAIFLRNPLVNVNWIHPLRSKSILQRAAENSAPDAIVDMILNAEGVDVILVGNPTTGFNALMAVVVAGPPTRLQAWLDDERFDVHMRSSEFDLSILDIACHRGKDWAVRIILQDRRVEPTCATFALNRLQVGPPSNYSMVLKHVGQRIRNDFQNARRVGNAKQIPRSVVDGKLLPMLGQSLFPAGFEIHQFPVKFIDVYRQMHGFMKLFGDVDSIAWPDLSDGEDARVDQFGYHPGAPSALVSNGGDNAGDMS